MNFTKGLLTEYHAIMATESRGCKTRDGGETDNLVLGLEKLSISPVVSLIFLSIQVLSLGKIV